MNKPVRHILIAVCAAIVAFLIHLVICRPTTAEQDDLKSHVETIMHQHRMQIEANINLITDSVSAAADTFELLNRLVASDDYSYYIFLNQELVAWQNPQLPIQDLQKRMLRRKMLHTDNGWYYIHHHLVDNLDVYALFRVSSSYAVENNYLRSEYDASLELDPRCKIDINPSGDGIRINDVDGAYLFTIRDNGIKKMSLTLFVADAIAMIIWIVAALVAAYLIAVHIGRTYRDNRALAAMALMLLGIYAWFVSSSVSPRMAESFFFSPQVFAFDWWMPSLASLFVFSAMAFALSQCVLRMSEFSLRPIFSMLDRWPKMRFAAMLALLFAIYSVVNVAISIMVYNSTDFAVYVGELDVSAPTLVKLAIITMLMVAFATMLEKVYAEMAFKVGWTEFFLTMFGLCAVVVIPTIIIMDDVYGIVFILGFVAMNSVYFLFKKSYDEPTPGIRYSHYIWFMFVVAFFVMARLTTLNHDKEQQNRELLVGNLSFSLVREDDPVAETLLSSIEHTIAADTIVQTFFESDGHAADGEYINLYGYIRSRYFDGYFSRYDLQVVPCRGDDSYIQMTMTGEEFNCYEYFQNMVDMFGQRIVPKSNFYLLNYNDGRASYFGQFRYYNKSKDSYDRLYLEINQKLQMVENGYPDLLTNSRDRIDTRQMKGYSYAKYYDGKLQIQYGGYGYPRHDSWIGAVPTGEKNSIEAEGLSHLAFAATQNQTVVLSYPTMTISQYMADYSYLFLAMLLISSIMLYVIGRRWSLLNENRTISERIQATFIFFVMLLLVVISILTTIETVRNYERQSNNHMLQTLASIKNSVVNELTDSDEALVNSLTADNVLQRATRTLIADAHLYSPNGMLIGTSRRELFDNGIASPLINSMALQSLRQTGGDDVFESEHIGNMEYYAAYSPIVIDDKVEAYLAVPYFHDEIGMRTQILSTIMPISNAYMIVILLAVLFSYFLAAGITKPLLAISNSLRRVDLQHKNDKIAYTGSDEIGVLVNEYNRMIDELEHSAEKLAASEREMTWREMARQIAHEIKNPLTPMKLNVQFMMKTWDKLSESGELDNAGEQTERFDAFVRKTSQSLVEQIDQLAFVASEFSNVAKMKQGEITKVDVAERLSRTVLLYSNSENASVTLETTVEHAYAMANAEQMTSVFNNLIKNALQSVAPEKEAVIKCSLRLDGDNIEIAVADNGRGIAPEVQDKIFRPNFTTKSTGMGLGLAIVKTIIVNAQGEIWFETELEKGTTFHVRLPKV